MGHRDLRLQKPLQDGGCFKLLGIVKAEQLKNILGTDYVHIQSKAEPVGTRVWLALRQ